MQSCCSPIASACPPIASASAAARRLRLLRISCCSLARLHPLQLLLSVCVRFQLLLPDCARFSCCCMLAAASDSAALLLPIVSASAAAPRLRPLQLLLPDYMHPLAAPAGFQPNVLKHSSRSSRFCKVRRSRVTIV